MVFKTQCVIKEEEKYENIRCEEKDSCGKGRGPILLV